MGIGVSGLMSGLDTDSIISKLMDLERRPITQLQKKEAGYQAKITALGLVKSAMSDFQSAVQSLKDSDDFISYSASSSNTDILTVSAGNDAIPSEYNIVVSQLAKAQQLKSASFSSADTSIGTGTITIKVGSGDSVNITIDSENNTLSGIAQAINDSDAAVTAAVINDGNGNYYLTLTAKDTGASNTINFTISDDDGNNDDASGLSSIYSNPSTHSLTETQAAQNAQLSINGISVERSSNEIDDLIDGVTINLKSADSSQTIKVTISKEYSGLTKKLQNFVSKYNELIDTINEQTAYNSATKQAATLLGDSTISRIKISLSNRLYEKVDNVDNSVNTLSKLGISIDENGHLSLDSSKLEEAISNHPEDVINFFTSTTTDNKGFAVKLDEFLEGYLKSSTGIIAAKTDGLQKSIDDIEEQIERINDRLSKREENLRHQFNALEDLLAQFQQTSGQLEQQLLAIKNLNAQISKSRS